MPRFPAPVRGDVADTHSDKCAREVLHAIEQPGRGSRGFLSSKIHRRRASDHAVRAIHTEGEENETACSGNGSEAEQIRDTEENEEDSHADKSKGNYRSSSSAEGSV